MVPCTSEWLTHDGKKRFLHMVQTEFRSTVEGEFDDVPTLEYTPEMENALRAAVAIDLDATFAHPGEHVTQAVRFVVATLVGHARRHVRHAYLKEHCAHALQPRGQREVVEKTNLLNREPHNASGMYTQFLESQRALRNHYSARR